MPPQEGVKTMSPKNECIYKKCFASLILDYEFKGSDGLPPYVSGRVLVDGYFHSHISAGSREELIKNFINGNY